MAVCCVFRLSMPTQSTHIEWIPLLGLRCICSTLTFCHQYKAPSFTHQPTLTHTQAFPVNGYLFKTYFYAHTFDSSLNSHHFVCLDQVRVSTLLSVCGIRFLSKCRFVCLESVRVCVKDFHIFLTTQGQKEVNVNFFSITQKLIYTPKITHTHCRSRTCDPTLIVSLSYALSLSLSLHSRLFACSALSTAFASLDNGHADT